MTSQRKPKKFSEKYAKGTKVGTGPFGQIYQCWMREDFFAGDHSMMDEAETRVSFDMKKKKKAGKK